MKFIKKLSISVLACFLVACSTTRDPAQIYKNQSAGEIYRGGEVALAKRAYGGAAEHFEALDALYPFSQYAEQAQLDLMYAYYKNDDNASAAAAAERFIRMYPRDPHVDYAYYIKGLANFDQDRGWFLRYFPSDVSERDPGTARQSFDDFSNLVRLFPNSVYAPDARQHMIYLRNVFAQYEINIANYYYARGAYVAAANRANYVIQHFDGTPEVQEALAINVKSYRALGLTDLANQSLSVLKLNYPNSRYLKDVIPA